MSNYKKDFPIFTNNSNLIYLDSASTTQKPKYVIDAISYFYENYNSNIRRGLYPLAEKASEKVEEVRKNVAQFIHADSKDEIVFVRNTTEGINLVMNSLDDGRFDFKSQIVTTIMEHHSNFVPWQFLSQQKKSEFIVLDINDNFEVIINEKEIKNSKILAITHISNVLGTINPIKEIIKKVRKINKNVFVIVDAAQSVAHIPINVKELDCDFLVFSGHKMFAGTGIGVLYGKKKLLSSLSPFLFGGEMVKEVSINKTTFQDIPYKFEAGTPDIAGIISLGASIEYINRTGINTIQKHEKMLAEYAYSELSNIPGITVYGPKNQAQVISFTLKNIHSHDVAQILADANICVRSGHHCAMPLHKKLGVPATARISFSIYNSEEDIQKCVKHIKKIINIFK